MLYNNCWDAGLSGKKQYSHCRRHTGKMNLPAMTQCPQIKTLKYCYSICQFNNAGWMFSWWCREGGWHHSGRQPSLCPSANKHIFMILLQYAKSRYVLTLSESFTNPQQPSHHRTVELYFVICWIKPINIYNRLSVAVNKLQDRKQLSFVPMSNCCLLPKMTTSWHWIFEVIDIYQIGAVHITVYEIYENNWITQTDCHVRWLL